MLVINHNNGFCRILSNFDATCGAHYTGEGVRFFRSGACANAAYSTVVYHEYGHHVIASGGSGQGAYGEGMSDAMSVLVTDDLEPEPGRAAQAAAQEFIRS